MKARITYLDVKGKVLSFTDQEVPDDVEVGFQMNVNVNDVWSQHPTTTSVVMQFLMPKRD